jgi:hypothetical protein
MGLFNRNSEVDRQWALYEGYQREDMERMRYTPDEIAHVLAVLKPIYARSNDGLAVGATGEQAVQQINAWIASLVLSLMKEISTREIELLRLQKK